jgi:hypothetical protein
MILIIRIFFLISLYESESTVKPYGHAINMSRIFAIAHIAKGFYLDLN